MIGLADGAVVVQRLDREARHFGTVDPLEGSARIFDKREGVGGRTII